MKKSGELIRKMNSSLFLSAPRFFYHRRFSTAPNIINDMMLQAQKLEDAFKIKEAAKTYEKIIYEVDPTFEPAYAKLMNIWLTYSSAHGLKQDKVDKYLKQHEAYIMPNKKTHSNPAKHQ